MRKLPSNPSRRASESFHVGEHTQAPGGWHSPTPGQKLQYWGPPCPDPTLGPSSPGCGSPSFTRSFNQLVNLSVSLTSVSCFHKSVGPKEWMLEPHSALQPSRQRHRICNQPWVGAAYGTEPLACGVQHHPQADSITVKLNYRTPVGCHKDPPGRGNSHMSSVTRSDVCYVQVKKTCLRRRIGVFLKNLENRQVALFYGNIRSRKKYQTPRKAGWGEGWKQGNLKRWHKQEARNPTLPDLPARTDSQNWGSQTGTLLQKHKPAKRKDPEILTCKDFTQQPHLQELHSEALSVTSPATRRDAKAGFSCFHCRCERRAKNYQSFEKNVYMEERDQNKHTEKWKYIPSVK